MINKTFYKCLILAMILCSLNLHAQAPARRFNTATNMLRLSRLNSTLDNNRVEMERYIREFVLNGPTLKPCIIPVVFHIIYSNKDEQVDAKNIIKQIGTLNEAFGGEDIRIKLKNDTVKQIIDVLTQKNRRQFIGKAADTQISFCLAKEDPQGRATSGVNYIVSKQLKWTMNDNMKLADKDGVGGWDPTKYLNIWVCRLADTVSGYAQMPGGPALTDGIVVDYRFITGVDKPKNPYSEGKTLVHLIGNYLNLYDLWGETRCADDFVSDTPIHNSPNYGCIYTQEVTTCFNNEPEMTMNFMDNSNDECLFMFTEGQKLRMHAVLSEKGVRGKLTTFKFKCDDKYTEAGIERARSFSNAVNEQKFAVLIHPNPVDHLLHVNISAPVSQKVYLQVFNTIGALFQQKEMLLTADQVYSMDIPCHAWPDGIYYLSVRGSTGQEYIQFIVEH
jgi:Pregnancy-associated plasma protein-A